VVLGVLEGFGCTCWARQMVLCVVAGAVVGFPMHWALAELARIKFRLLLWFSPPIMVFAENAEESWVFELSRNLSIHKFRNLPRNLQKCLRSAFGASRLKRIELDIDA